MKAMIRDPNMVTKDCKKDPRRSEMPSCKVFEVVLMAVAGAP